MPLSKSEWRGGGDMTLLILNLVIGWKWSASHPCRFTAGEETHIPKEQEDWWVPKTSGTLQKRKIHCPYRESKKDSSVWQWNIRRRGAALSASLSSLLYLKKEPAVVDEIPDNPTVQTNMDSCDCMPARLLRLDSRQRYEYSQTCREDHQPSIFAIKTVQHWPTTSDHNPWRLPPASIHAPSAQRRISSLRTLPHHQTSLLSCHHSSFVWHVSVSTLGPEAGFLTAELLCFPQFALRAATLSPK